MHAMQAWEGLCTAVASAIAADMPLNPYGTRPALPHTPPQRPTCADQQAAGDAHKHDGALHHVEHVDGADGLELCALVRVNGASKLTRLMPAVQQYRESSMK